MSYAVQVVQERPRPAAMAREHGVYQEAERANGGMRKPRAIADALEARTRAARAGGPGHLVSVWA